MQSIGLDIRVLSGDSKEIIIRDDDDDDDRAVRKKAEDLGVDVGSYGDHDVKTSEPPPADDIIADDFEQERTLTDEEIDAQLDSLGDLDKVTPDDLSLDGIDPNATQKNDDDNFSDDIAPLSRYNDDNELWAVVVRD